MSTQTNHPDKKGLIAVATQTTVRLVDDLDGTEAAETVEFGLAGHTYEIDLSAANASELRELLAEFVGAARKVQGQAKRQARTTTASKALSEGQEARAWLLEHDYQVPAKGKLSQDWLDVWRQNKDQVPEEVPATKPAAPELVTEPTDEEVNTWWEFKGYKPGASIALRRAQWKRAHKVA